MIQEPDTYLQKTFNVLHNYVSRVCLFDNPALLNCARQTTISQFRHHVLEAVNSGHYALQPSLLVPPCQHGLPRAGMDYKIIYCDDGILCLSIVYHLYE